MAHTSPPLEAQDVGIDLENLLLEQLLRGSLRNPSANVNRVVTWCLPLSELIGDANHPHQCTEDLTGIAVHLPSWRLADGDTTQRLIESLSAAGVAAVMAWPQPGCSTPSLNRAIAAAEVAGVAFLDLPLEADYQRTSRLIATKSLAQSSHVLSYSTRVHEEIADVLARGTGLASLARTMSNLAQTSVMILGNDHELLAHAISGLQSDAGINAIKDHSDIVPRIINYLTPGAIDPKISPTATVTVELDTGPAQLIVAPVLLAGERLGSVVLIARSSDADSHRLIQQTIVCKEGATLTGSELLRQNSVRRAKERARNDFVYALLYGRFTDQLELAARSQYYKFQPDGRYAVLVVIAGRDQAMQPDDNRALASTARAIAAGYPANKDTHVLTGQIGPMIIVIKQLLPVTSHVGDVLSERTLLRDFADQTNRVAQGLLGSGARVAYGRADDGVAGVSRSYREARIALALGEQASDTSVYPYDDLRVYAAIQEVAQSPSGLNFAKEVLSPLQHADGQTGDLKMLALAYIEESGNVNATARRLHLHRNTMLYKLNRVSRALRMDIRKSETQFMIWLACRIETLSEVQADFADELTLPS